MGAELTEGAAVGLLLALGVLVSLDGTSVGQVMVSRPIVAAPVAGWLAGSLEAGLLVGLLLELLYLPVLPVGGGRFPEVGVAGVSGGAAAAAGEGSGGMAAALLVAVGAGALGGGTIRALRTLNGRLAPDPSGPRLKPADIRRAHLLGLALDALRGLAVTALGLAAALGVAPRLAAYWPLGPGATMGLLVTCAAFSLGLLLSNLTAGRGVRLTLLAVGGAGGLLLAVVFG